MCVVIIGVAQWKRVVPMFLRSSIGALLLVVTSCAIARMGVLQHSVALDLSICSELGPSQRRVVSRAD